VGGCVLLAVSLLAATSVAAVLVLRHSPGEDNWRTALLVYGPQWPWAVLPALACLLALVTRRPRLAAANALVLFVALGPVADFQLPGPAPDVDGERLVRVLTWNLHGRVVRIEQIREQILKWDPDIVCVQEARSNDFRELLPGWNHRMAVDLRIFSRDELSPRRMVPMGIYPARIALECEVQTRAGALTVLNVHFPRAIRREGLPRELEPMAEYMQEGMEVRRSKFDHLIQWLPGGAQHTPDRPLIVAGDMNTPPASMHYRRLAEHLTDAFAARGLGLGLTFVLRDRWPLLRIDYVWCGGGVQPVRCWTGDGGPSDHRPVIADIALPAEAPSGGDAAGD